MGRPYPGPHGAQEGAPSGTDNHVVGSVARRRLPAAPGKGTRVNSHHDLLYEYLVRERLQDLESYCERRHLSMLARRAARDARTRSRWVTGVRCSIARALMALAQRLDAKAPSAPGASAPRAGRRQGAS